MWKWPCNSCSGVLRGYHIYMEECGAAIREELQCEGEETNMKDLYTVTVVYDNVVSHLPQKIS